MTEVADNVVAFIKLVSQVDDTYKVERLLFCFLPETTQTHPCRIRDCKFDCGDVCTLQSLNDMIYSYEHSFGKPRLPKRHYMRHKAIKYFIKCRRSANKFKTPFIVLSLMCITLGAGTAV